MSKHESGNVKDLRALKNLMSERYARINQAAAVAVSADPVQELTSKLHPHRQYLRIDAIKAETNSTRTFRLIPDIENNTTNAINMKEIL